MRRINESINSQDDNPFFHLSSFVMKGSPIPYKNRYEPLEDFPEDYLADAIVKLLNQATGFFFVRSRLIVRGYFDLEQHRENLIRAGIIAFPFMINQVLDNPLQKDSAALLISRLPSYAGRQPLGCVWLGNTSMHTSIVNTDFSQMNDLMHLGNLDEVRSELISKDPELKYDPNFGMFICRLPSAADNSYGLVSVKKVYL